jgi:hypothetical protein
MPVQEQENPAVMAERTRQWEANQIDAEIRTVKDLRQSIDLQIQRVKALSPSRDGPEAHQRGKSGRVAQPLPQQQRPVEH